ncbi:hypothetical protein BHE74_00034348 [Ensete ventricosum]|nr:hypothetical protein BHE74_00034348 [Ensete ventricosum]
MYHASKFSTVSMTPDNGQGTEQVGSIGISRGSSVNNPVNPGGSGKQRLRWTSDLHDCFVDAITQLGGPDSGYFLSSHGCLSNSKRCFKSNGCTGHYNISCEKSFTGMESSFKLRLLGFFPRIYLVFIFPILQKYRLAKYLPDSPADGKSLVICLFMHLREIQIKDMFIVGSKDDKKDSGHTHSDTDSAPCAILMPEVYINLTCIFQVQRQLQLRIEAQGRYLQKIIEEQQKLKGVVQKHKSSLSPPISDSNRNPSSLKKPRMAVVNQSSDAGQETPKQDSNPDLSSNHCIISCGFEAGTKLDEGTGNTAERPE